MRCRLRCVHRASPSVFERVAGLKVARVLTYALYEEGDLEGWEIVMH